MHSHCKIIFRVPILKTMKGLTQKQKLSVGNGLGNMQKLLCYDFLPSTEKNMTQAKLNVSSIVIVQ